MAENLNCRELTEFIQRYLDGELPDEQRQVFETHLQRCPPCVHYLESYQTTVELEKGCAECEDSMPEALIAAIAEAMRKSRE
ncbi:MAG TPA: zf-HC2 domain-containing protein [Candidatus Krumholzibacteria bacterium]|jgi:anti-sigma factor RsiW